MNEKILAHCSNQVEMVDLRYCPEHEVMRKSQQFLTFKARFSIQLKQLINKGRSISTMNNFEIWIDDNIDNLYNNQNL